MGHGLETVEGRGLAEGFFKPQIAPVVVLISTENVADFVRKLISVLRPEGFLGRQLYEVFTIGPALKKSNGAMLPPADFHGKLGHLGHVDQQLISGRPAYRRYVGSRGIELFGINLQAESLSGVCEGLIRMTAHKHSERD